MLLCSQVKQTCNRRFSKRIILYVVFMFGLVQGLTTFYFNTCGAESNIVQKQHSLQQVINSAKAGQTIILPAGTFEESVTISKPLSICGNGEVTLLNTKKQPAITIKADYVNIKGITIKHKSDKSSPAILVRGSYTTIKEMTIHTIGYGIMLRDANKVNISNNKITGAALPFKHKGKRYKNNGIDLHHCSQHQICNNDLSYLRDAIYLENCNKINVQGNTVNNNRYGIHFMYIDDSFILDNRGQHNVTGAMVMGVDNSVVANNTFSKQKKNVHSQGILLYDVYNSIIKQNTVDNNRVGLYVEQSSTNEIKNNAILRNFVGIQLIRSEDNKIESNGLVGNVIEAEAVNSKKNFIKENYWDSFSGLDITHTGTSDIPYVISPFFRTIVRQNVAFQLFFQSPSITFLSGMFTDDRHHWPTDTKPRMKMHIGLPDNDYKIDLSVLVVSVLLLCTSVFIILYLGVKRV